MYFLLHPISSLNHFVARVATDQITLLISIVLFITISLNYKKGFWIKVDKTVLLLAEEAKQGFIKKHSEDFAILGNAIFHILFSIVLAIIFFIAKHNVAIVISILFTLVLSWGLNRLLKLIYKRQRPESLYSGMAKRLSYCFPSGHVMASIPIYFFGGMLLQTFLPFLPWYLIALVCSYLVVMTRIYLNHHYFTDVLAGICMAIFCLNISIWFYFFIALI